MKQGLITALFLIAAIVATVLLIRRAAPWPLIAAYWITLTLKNLIDVKEGKEWH